VLTAPVAAATAATAVVRLKLVASVSGLGSTIVVVVLSTSLTAKHCRSTPATSRVARRRRWRYVAMAITVHNGRMIYQGHVNLLSAAQSADRLISRK